MTHAAFPFVVAMAQPGQQQNALITMAPFALMIAIFYFVLYMPMRRRQKKVADFQGALKVGDRIITTGGIYGVIQKLDAQSVQIQVADKVRIEIARAAIGGYQGQEPVVQPNQGSF